MPNLKKLLITTSFALACLLSLAGHALAEQRYIVDTIVVSLREGPGSQFKFIKTLKTGQSFEVLETKNDYVRVRTADGDEGWLQKQFTDTNPPNATAVKDLNDKINTLKAQNVELTAQLAHKGQTSTTDSKGLTPGSEETTEIKKLQDDLAEMTKRYNQLEIDAKDVLKISTERNRLQATLTSMQKNLAELQQENTLLANRQTIYWFLAGGGVLLLGWMLGRISFRRQRHSLTL
jgi:SH3 domain protein